MARTIALSVGFALVAAGALAQDPPRRYAVCTAAERNAPTLNKTLIPSATFEMVEDQISPPRGQPGPVWLKHGFEKAQLEPGVALEVNLTGCDHHGNAYRFRIPKDNTPTTETKYWLGKAIAMVERVEKANTDSMVDLGALKRTLQSRVRDPNARPFRQDSLDGAIFRGGGEERGRIQEAYLVTINQRREDSTLISVTYLIGPL